MTAIEKAESLSNIALQTVWQALMKLKEVNWKDIWNTETGETMDDWGSAIYSEMDKRDLDKAIS